MVVMPEHVVTVTEVLDGHVALDVQCLDRIYLNAYVPMLQTSAQVVAFLSHHLGFPFPSPALFKQLGDRFRRAVSKLELMRPHLDRQAATGCSGVAAIGVAQEFQRVWSAYERQGPTGACQWWFTKADRRVSCYYFYLWDIDVGPAFIKVCTYFPYPAKGLAQRPRVGQAPGRARRCRVHRAGRRVRRHRRPGCAAGYL
jgi:hypothetical protein